MMKYKGSKGNFISLSPKKNKLFTWVQVQKAEEANTIGYMPASLINITLPHSAPKSPYYTRKNGSLRLTMTACHPDYPLPSGSLARLILAGITKQAVLNKKSEHIDEDKKRVIYLGSSFSAFIKTLGLSLSGGKHCSRERLREQILRLVNTVITVHQDDQKGGGAQCHQRVCVAQAYQLWWDPKDPVNGLTPGSTLTLTQDFYNDIVKNAVPFDFRVLQALTKSPLQMDIYLWLTYRYFSLKKAVEIPWAKLKSQFGSSYPDDAQGISVFKRKLSKALQIISLIYPEANVYVTGKGVLLLPSLTHVKQKAVVDKSCGESELSTHKRYEDFNDYTHKRYDKYAQSVRAI